jgi:hypothetical protein
MKVLRILAVLSAFSVMVCTAEAQGTKQKYIGKSSCDRELQAKRPDFSMGLDKAQRTYLIHRYLSDAAVLLLVQLEGGSDRCGVIRDVIEIRAASEEFEFSCVDPELSGDVVIGSKRKNSREPLYALEAWRIDLTHNRFERTTRRVRCRDENPLDSPDVGDLAEQARRRAAQQKSQQN